MTNQTTNPGSADAAAQPASTSARNTPIFRLIPAAAYPDELARLIPTARHRIDIIAMMVSSGPRTDQLFKLIATALERGVRVRIVLDAYTDFFLATRTLALARRQLGGRSVRRNHALLRRLATLGAEVTTLGHIGPNPFAGRCHLKITLVDDHIFTFGGVNFDDAQFITADYLLAATHATLANQLADVITATIAANHPSLAARTTFDATDLTIPLSSHHTALVDVGIRRQSLIYDRACALAAQSTRVHYVSQMAPSGRLAHLLRATDAQVYHNRLRQMDTPDNLAAAFDILGHRLPNSYHRSTYIHAKFILFELTDGTQALITGSHNFSYRGVSFGTQEIALESTDPALWQTLHQYLTEHIQS